MTTLLLWLPLSLVVGIAVGRCIRVGMVDQQSAKRVIPDIPSIKEKMVEHRHYDWLNDRVLYRWNFGRYSAHLKFYREFGDEKAWADVARTAAAKVIQQMAMEAQP